MQQCGNCGFVYDESEYSKCPKCHPNNQWLNEIMDDEDEDD